MNVLDPQRKLSKLYVLRRQIDHEIAQLEAQRSATKPARNWPAKCGTDGGYRKHLRRGETACRPCKDAHADDEARRAARRRQVA